MSRRGLAAVAIAVGGVLVLALVAFVAYNAGARTGGYEIGRMRGPGFSIGMGGWFGGGWFGGGIGLLLLLLLVGGIVWAVVALTRPEPGTPSPPPSGFQAPQPSSPPPAPGVQAPPQAPSAPSAPPPPPAAPAAPAPGSVEAFEAWHRQAHAAETSSTTSDATKEADPPAG